MINRILIRIKVVQILYSYLLSRSEFKIEVAPETTSRDRKFAYAVYLDMMQLLLELSGVKTPIQGRQLPQIAVEKRLASNRVAHALADNDTFKAVVLKASADDINAFAPIMQSLHDKIVASVAFADFKKVRNHQLANDVKMWALVLKTTIAKDRSVEEVMRANPEFTMAGFRRGIDMLVHTLESFNDSRSAYTNARRELEQSLDKAYDLYHAMFALILDLTAEQEMRLETARNKYLATDDELNPDMRFVNGPLVLRLRADEYFCDYIKSHDITWQDQPALLRSLLDSILASEMYRDYMSGDPVSFDGDCAFWRDVLRLIILPSDELADAIEEKSVYWNDDLHIMGTFVLKTLRQFGQGGEDAPLTFLPKYKDDEDAEFGDRLFALAVEHREEYRSYIDSFVNSSWDPDRLAFMDIVLMISAIAEMVNFPAIPIPVSMNEYVEIANMYSTDRSGAFINGTLYSIVNKLKADGKLLKTID